ncbi:MAG: hypothetical protein ABI640_02270 [Gammaproteobacteria bacterium]
MPALTTRVARRLKSTGLVNRLVRYSPRHYGEVRHLLRDLDAKDRERRRALSLRLTARALTWARRAPVGREHGASLADWPIIDQRALRERASSYCVLECSWLPAETAGTTGAPVSVDRSRRCLAAGQAFIDDLMGVWDLTFATARIARLRSDSAHVQLEAVPGSDSPPGHRAFGIIATGFWNEAMPLVRYRTDDVAFVPDSYTPSDIDDVTLGLKPVVAIRRASGERPRSSGAC